MANKNSASDAEWAEMMRLLRTLTVQMHDLKQRVDANEDAGTNKRGADASSDSKGAAAKKSAGSGSKKTQNRDLKAVLLPKQEVLNQANRILRIVIRRMFNIKTAWEFAFHKPASDDELEACNFGDLEPGPDDDGHWHWDFNLLTYLCSRWNTLVVEAIINAFFEEKDSTIVEDTPQIHEVLGIVITEKLIGYRGHWGKAQKKEGETLDDAQLRAALEQQKRQVYARSNSSKHRKYDKRVETVERVICILLKEGDEDVVYWQWILQLTRHVLGRRSAIGENQTLLSFLRSLDEQTVKFAATRTGAGGKYQERQRDDAKESASAPPAKLSQSLYSSSWLAEQDFTVVKKLQISKETFAFLDETVSLCDLVPRPDNDQRDDAMDVDSVGIDNQASPTPGPPTSAASASASPPPEQGRQTLCVPTVTFDEDDILDFGEPTPPPSPTIMPVENTQNPPTSDVPESDNNSDEIDLPPSSPPARDNSPLDPAWDPTSPFPQLLCPGVPATTVPATTVLKRQQKRQQDPPEIRCPTLPKHLACFDGFMHDGQGIWGVHYGDLNFLVNMPEWEMPPHLFRRYKRDFTTPSWLTPKTAQLMFLPRAAPFRDRLFAPLDIDLNRILITRLPGATKEDERYILTAKVSKQWTTMEIILLKIIRTLHSMLPSDTPRYESAFSIPWAYRYYEQAADPRTIVLRVRRAQAAFLPLMATITLYFVLLDDQVERERVASGSANTRDWRRVLQSTLGLNWQFLEDLQSSVVGDMNVERMGGMVDISNPWADNRNTPGRRSIFSLVLGKHKVPLAFLFGDVKFPLEIHSIPEKLVYNQFIPDEAEVEYLKGLPGEVAFSPWRARASGTGMESGRGQPPIENLDPNDRRVSQRNPRPELFVMPGANQYRSALNTRTSAILAQVDVPGQNKDHDDSFGEYLDQDEALSGQLPAATSTVTQDANEIVDDMYPPAVVLNPGVGYHQISSAGIAARWYGLYVTDVAAAQARPADEKIAVLATKWLLGDVQAPTTTPFAELMFYHMKQAGQVRDIPRFLSDLSNRHAPLLVQHQFHFNVKRVFWGQSRLFMILPDHDDDQPFILADAATVLFALRSAFNDTDELVRGLTEVGAKFSVCWRREKSRVETIPARDVPHLGNRPFGHTASASEYRAYVYRRNRYLNSYRGLLMLAEGGIWARISRAVVPGYATALLMRPEDQDLDEAILLADLEPGYGLYKETLTRDEKDLVSGVYAVQVEQVGDFSIKFLSWWPMWDSWDKSAHSMGIWNENCERWYQQQSASMENGSFQLQNNAYWNHQRCSNLALKISSHHQDLALAFLDTIASGYL
uniref:Uncharacterized protein n=1 Tax=Mycena chlorophos TaxID=658473 RepID=A0ABQ0L4X5_MYCCL|nr:predicted protein [Mycena chlorophos]